MSTNGNKLLLAMELLSHTTLAEAKEHLNPKAAAENTGVNFGGKIFTETKPRVNRFNPIYALIACLCLVIGGSSLMIYLFGGQHDLYFPEIANTLGDTGYVDYTSETPSDAQSVGGYTWIVEPVFNYDIISYCEPCEVFRGHNYSENPETGEQALFSDILNPETGLPTGELHESHPKYFYAPKVWVYDPELDLFGWFQNISLEMTVELKPRAEFKTHFPEETDRINLVRRYDTLNKDFPGGETWTGSAVAVGNEFITDFIYYIQGYGKRQTNVISLIDEESGLHGVINKQGEMIIPFSFNHIALISDNTAFARLEAGDKWGIIRFGLCDPDGFGVCLDELTRISHEVKTVEELIQAVENHDCAAEVKVFKSAADSEAEINQVFEGEIRDMYVKIYYHFGDSWVSLFTGETAEPPERPELPEPVELANGARVTFEPGRYDFTTRVFVEYANADAVLLYETFSFDIQTVISPDGKKVAYNNHEGQGYMSYAFIFDVETRQNAAIEGTAFEHPDRPKRIIWLDNDYLLIIAGLANGSMSHGGDIYSYNIKSGESVLLIEAVEYSDEIEIAEFINFEKEDNNLKINYRVTDNTGVEIQNSYEHIDVSRIYELIESGEALMFDYSEF